MFKNTTVLLDGPKSPHLPPLYFTYQYWYVNTSISHPISTLKFVSEDFTIRAAPGLSGPANTCANSVHKFQKIINTLRACIITDWVAMDQKKKNEKKVISGV